MLWLMTKTILCESLRFLAQLCEIAVARRTAKVAQKFAEKIPDTKY